MAAESAHFGRSHRQLTFEPAASRLVSLSYSSSSKRRSSEVSTWSRNQAFDGMGVLLDDGCEDVAVRLQLALADMHGCVSHDGDPPAATTVPDRTHALDHCAQRRVGGRRHKLSVERRGGAQHLFLGGVGPFIPSGLARGRAAIRSSMSLRNPGRPPHLRSRQRAIHPRRRRRAHSGWVPTLTLAVPALGHCH